MHEDEYALMSEVEESHWWYRSLHSLVLRTINYHFNSNDIVIVDAACGTGGLMLFLKGHGFNTIKGFDLSDVAVATCMKRNLDAFKADLRDSAKYFSKKSVDVVVCNDAFYFLDNAEQRNLTDVIHELLKTGGLLILNMPAMRAFRGAHDLRVGIGKRFDKRDLKDLFDSNKYELLRQTYWPFFLSFLIWPARFFQRVKMNLSKSIPITSDLSRNAGLGNSLFFLITSTENKILSRKPFGSSLYIVLRAK